MHALKYEIIIIFFIYARIRSTYLHKSAVYTCSINFTKYKDVTIYQFYKLMHAPIIQTRFELREPCRWITRKELHKQPIYHAK